VLLADHVRVMATALILAGAVAKGAFEAGVLSVIAEQRFEIASLVATSAGALNATLYAAGLRYRRAPLGAQVLHDLWLDKATWTNIVRPSLRGLFGGRGLSSAAGLEAVLSDGLSRVVPSSLSELRDPAPVSLTLVATSLNGAIRPNGNSRATSFEHAVSFEGSVFDTRSGRDRVCRAALASAALPILFEPVELPDVGPSIDGGIVNNTPISHAIDAGIDRVIVITGNPLEAENRRAFRFLDLVGQAADIAVNERLFRDLLQARKVNDKLDRLTDALRAFRRECGAARRRQLGARLEKAGRDRDPARGAAPGQRLRRARQPPAARGVPRPRRPCGRARAGRSRRGRSESHEGGSAGRSEALNLRGLPSSCES
jgi:NTE family protein